MAAKKLFALKVQSGVYLSTIYVTADKVVVEMWDHAAANFAPIYSEEFDTLVDAYAYAIRTIPAFTGINPIGVYRLEMAYKIDAVQQEAFLPDANVTDLLEVETRLIAVHVG